MLRQLCVPEEAMLGPDDKEVVLKAMLNGIGESTVKLDWFLSETNITKMHLLASGSYAEREHLRKSLAKDLKHALAGFHAMDAWHRRQCFSPFPFFLTDGA